MKTFQLNSTKTIPALGFGTWQIMGETCVKAVELAISTGYRHIDCASAYENQKDVKKGIQNSEIKREELFITSKLWTSDMQRVRDACKKTLDELGVEFLDLYLMHWPNRNLKMNETLEALVGLKEDGLIKEWGVSNCTVNHLKDFIRDGFHPANNQVEFHPSLNQSELKEFCDVNNILLTAYSPIAQGADLKLPLIIELSKKYKRSTSQIVLNWLISKKIVAIPKASTLDHIQDNFNTLSWELAEEDVSKIDQLNTNNRVILPDWGEFNY